MRNAKKALAATTLLVALLLGFYLLRTQSSNKNSSNDQSIEVAGEGLTETAADKSVSTVLQVQTAQTEKATTESTTTVKDTETQTSEASTKAVATETPTEVETTVAPTQAPTQATTQAPTQTPSTEAAKQTTENTDTKVTYTNVVYKDAYNTYNYSNLDEAKKNINVSILSDAQAKAQAISNKSKFANEAEQVLELINNYRASLGLSKLKYNDTLATAAMHRAAESAYANWNMTAYENGTTKRHIRPNFQKASTIFSYYGLTGNFGENYGRFQASPEEILQGWKESSAHNELMTSTSYSQIGIGVAKDSDGYYYWIALFM